MKKLTALLLVILSLSTILLGQGYRNIITPGTAFYSGGISTSIFPSFLSGVHIDSAFSAGNGDTVFLAANTIRPVSVNTGPPDTAGGILGRRIVKMHDGWFRFINVTGDTISLNSGAALNDTWKFIALPSDGQIRATCTSIQLMTFAGVTDSVKEFTLQAVNFSGEGIPHDFNGKVIRLSRNYGLTLTYNLFRFPDYSPPYNLEGRNTPVAGFQGLTAHEIYDYAVGDEFHYSGVILWPRGITYIEHSYKRINKVLAKQVSPAQDSVKYTFAYCDEGHDIFYGDTYSNGTENISYSYGSSTTEFPFNRIPEKFTGTSTRYYSALQHFVAGLPALGHAWGCFNCCWSLNPNFNIDNSDEEYTAGLGRVYSKFLVSLPAAGFYDYQWEKLVYFKKGAVQWGTPLYTSCSAMSPIKWTPDTIFLGPKPGSTCMVNITTGQYWTLNQQATWYTFQPGSGTGSAQVTFSAPDPNVSGQKQSVVVLTNGSPFNNVTMHIPVYQLSVAALANPDTVQLRWENHSKDTLTVFSDTSWRVETSGLPAWVTCSPVTGNGNSQIVIEALQDNSGPSDRLAEMSLVYPGGSQPLPIRQSTKSSGISQQQPQQLRIYPVPVRESAVVSLDGWRDHPTKLLVLFDFTGKPVFSNKFSGSVYYLLRESLTPGIYLLRITSADGTQLVSKQLILE